MIELSRRAENALGLLSVSAVDAGCGRGSTCANRLRPSDVAAALGAIEDKRWRCSLVWAAGLGDASERVQLLAAVRTELFSYQWELPGKKGQYLKLMQSSTKRVKLNAVIGCALDRLRGVSLLQVDKANCLGISERGYRKNWEAVERDANTILFEWLYAGERVFLNQLYGERECA